LKIGTNSVFAFGSSDIKDAVNEDKNFMYDWMVADIDYATRSCGDLGVLEAGVEEANVIGFPAVTSIGACSGSYRTMRSRGP
jgi:hypothetical protein